VYLMISSYVVPLDEVDKVRADHLAFVDALEERGLVVSAGRQDPPVGGVVILDVPTEAEAQEIMADDPYVLAKVAEYRAVSFLPARGVLKDYHPAQGRR
jgi:uncharacterized protein YciI